jgi:hypothetical protein
VDHVKAVCRRFPAAKATTLCFSHSDTGSDEKILANDFPDVSANDASRDGASLVLPVGSNNDELWIYHTATRTSEPLLTQPHSEICGTFWPDELPLAYQSGETRKAEIYIRELSPTSGKWQVSTAHGKLPPALPPLTVRGSTSSHPPIRVIPLSLRLSKTGQKSSRSRTGKEGRSSIPRSAFPEQFAAGMCT